MNIQRNKSNNVCVGLQQKLKLFEIKVLVLITRYMSHNKILFVYLLLKKFYVENILVYNFF